MASPTEKATPMESPVPIAFFGMATIYAEATLAQQTRIRDKNGNILMEQGNDFQAGGSAYHAETLLLLKAAKKYSPEFLKQCTLYSNFEPCCMCTGALYWTNVGRLVYGATEKDLLKFTGDNEENPTFSLSSRDVVAHGQKDIVIEGPTDDDELLEQICKDHIDFWN